jgi:RNA polymerase sigma factor (sigma-70 family)
MKDLHIDDVALLRGFNNRDKYTINKLHSLVYKKFFWFAYSFLKDKELAQDAVTDAFIALLNAQDEFANMDNITAWLYNRVRWNCWVALRPKASRHMLRTTDELMDIPDEDATVEEKRIKAEVYHAILQEIEKLPARHKAILKLYFFEGKTTPEIAKLLEMNVKTVHNTRGLLLKSIKNELIRKSMTVIILGFLLPVQ